MAKKNQGEIISEQEIIKDIAEQSFAEQIENDKEKSAIYIKEIQRASLQNVSDPISTQKIKGGNVYKRALCLVGSGDLKITDNLGNSQDAIENKLPVSSYLSHGSRVMIEIPAGSDDKLINWLTSGNSRESGISQNQSQKGAIDEGKIVYNRSAATHDVDIIKNSDGKYSLKEKKGLLIGVKDFALNKLGKDTKHFGVDLALNINEEGKDSTGKIVNQQDGEHGHLYIHYNKPTKDRPGSLLIGVEGSAPSSSKHSKLGASDGKSAIDGCKFDDLAIKKEIAGEEEYEKTIIPKKYGGMSIKLDENKLNKIIEMDADKFGTELAYATPKKDPDDFVEKLKTYSHKTPEFKKSKIVEKPKKVSFVKVGLNKFLKIVSFGKVKVFQKEIDKYKKSRYQTKISDKQNYTYDQKKINKEKENKKQIEIQQKDIVNETKSKIVGNEKKTEDSKGLTDRNNNVKTISKKKIVNNKISNENRKKYDKVDNFLNQLKKNNKSQYTSNNPRIARKMKFERAKHSKSI